MRKSVDEAYEQLNAIPLGPSEIPMEQEIPQDEMGQEEMIQGDLMQQALGLNQGGS